MNINKKFRLFQYSDVQMFKFPESGSSFARLLRSNILRIESERFFILLFDFRQNKLAYSFNIGPNAGLFCVSRWPLKFRSLERKMHMISR
jgi:hypothetical protein